jgi:hypothetical protein
MDVNLHCPFSKPKLARNLFVRQPANDKARNFPLAFGEYFELIV